MIRNRKDRILVGLFGHPVHHSKSPAMHQAAFEACQIQGSYHAFDIAHENLAQAVESIRILGLRGVNVTIPHKIEVMQYLDHITPEAADIGAVNTILNENGTLIGTNTDGIGYVRSLQEELQVDVRELHILILGAGGAARAIATQLAMEGAKSISIANRTAEKAIQLAKDLSERYPCVKAVSMDTLHTIRFDVQLVINTTSVGMYPHVDTSPLPASFLSSGCIASDLVYNPRLTKFLEDARNAGCTIHEGIGMLVYQGAEAFRLWTHVEPPIEVMRQAILAQL